MTNLCGSADRTAQGSIIGHTGAAPVTKVPIALISDGASPRRSGPDLEHIRALAESDDPLPPILIQRSTMSVIDGMHRVLAAKMRGQEEIEARLIDGDQAICFVMAVSVNVKHGLPLSLDDRKAAAKRIIRFYPSWSDRKIASVSGLAARTVAGLRDHPSLEDNHPEGRIGRDGRARPVNAAERREIAAEIIGKRPDASLREIARHAGISPETARKIRRQLCNGTTVQQLHNSVSAPAGSQPENADQSFALHALRRDPALRSKERGRLLLRMLSVLEVLEENADQILSDISLHDMRWVAEASRACSHAWERFAYLAELAERQKIAAGTH